MKKTLVLSLLIPVTLVMSTIPVRADVPDETLVFGYCGNYSRGLGSSESSITTVSAAIEIPEDLARSWTGAELVKVNVGYGKSSVNEIEIFITKELDGTPLYTQTAVMQELEGWNQVELDIPFSIDGTPFYIGYSTSINSSSDIPLGVDNVPTSDNYADLVNNYGEWEHIGKYYGSVCLQLELIGEHLAQNNVDATGLVLPPLVKLDTPFSATLTFTNNGLRNVNSLKIESSVNGVAQEPMEFSMDSPVKSGQDGEIVINDLRCEGTGRDLPVVLTISEVNGVPNESLNGASQTMTVSCAEEFYAQNVLVEEFTGTWCGWCPRGIVAMAYMEENYGDKGFIGIAVHYGDPMAVESYAPLASIYADAPGYPYALINRGFGFDPFPENMVELFNEVTQFYSPAEVGITVDYDEENNSLEATATTLFSFDETDANYALAFVITENGIGPYPQTNSYAGGYSGEMGGWGSESSSVPTIYNEVARYIDTVWGIEGSVPSELTAGKTYTYTVSLPTDNIEDINQCTFIALLIDQETGNIVNSGKFRLNSGAGVETLETGMDPELYVVYNLQGVKVLETKDRATIDSLPKGIYIVNGKKIIK